MCLKRNKGHFYCFFPFIFWSVHFDRQNALCAMAPPWNPKMRVMDTSTSSLKIGQVQAKLSDLLYFGAKLGTSTWPILML